MELAKLISVAQKTLKENSPVILTALGVSGAIGTAYLTAVASFRAAKRLDEVEEATSKEKVLIVWDLYIPPVVSGVMTVGFIVGANRAASSKTAAAYSALAVSEKVISEYKDKVIETIGEKKEQKIRDEIAQDRITNHPPQNVIVTGNGQVLCCELYTGRYFLCDMETINKAVNKINHQLVHEMYATLDDFYYLINLIPTSHSGQIGWNSDKLLALGISTCLSTDERPCLAFEYNYVRPI